MSRNKIKICGFCCNNEFAAGVTFKKQKGRKFVKYYMIDDCCDNCYFIKETEYKNAIEAQRKESKKLKSNVSNNMNTITKSRLTRYNQ